MPKLGHTDLDVHPLCLGGNVFGWTADREASFAVLDAYIEAGGNFIDTADLYGGGGASEEILGRWLRSRGRRDDLVLATKVGMWDQRPGLTPGNIQRAIEDSLRRLQTDHVDLYYAHQDDPGTPLSETLAAFDDLVRQGKIMHAAASNYPAPRLAEAIAVAERESLSGYAVFQPKYNLMERAAYEGELAEVCADHGIAAVPYYGLARGFLTGKYRPGGARVDSPRAEGALGYLDGRGLAVLAALDEIAAGHDVPVAAVALAWLVAQPTVAAAIASARSPEQLADLLPMAGLELSSDELDHLGAASIEPARA